MLSVLLRRGRLWNSGMFWDYSYLGGSRSIGTVGRRIVERAASLRGGGGWEKTLNATTHTNTNSLYSQRNGMINISPVGRNASIQERIEFEQYDKTHQIRAKFVEVLREKFADFGLT